MVGRIKEVTLYAGTALAEILPNADGEIPKKVKAGGRAIPEKSDFGLARLKVQPHVAAPWEAQLKKLKQKITQKKLNGLIEFVTAAEAETADLHLHLIPARSTTDATDLLPELTTPLTKPHWAVLQSGQLAMPLHAIDGSCGCTTRQNNGTTKAAHDPTEDGVIHLLTENLRNYAQSQRLAQ